MITPVQTPLMQQYREIKSRHQHAILFFRMGEFYEMFYDDAETASRVLGLTLTSRNNGGAAQVPLAGIPVKAASDYLRRLVQHGFRVAICEQVEDPRTAKGVVKREVIETVTPGAAFADDLLDGARNNFVMALCPAVGVPAASTVPRRVQMSAVNAPVMGVAAADVSTGELRLAVIATADLEAYIARFAPREILLPPAALLPTGPLPTPSSALVTERPGWEFDPALAHQDLAGQYGVQSLEGLGIHDTDGPAIGAAGALLRYLRELQPAGLPQLARPIVERGGGVMPLDEMTRRNLELVESLRGDGEGGTLLSVLDRTRTPMGARLLRQWLLAPLTDQARIDERLDAVESFVTGAIARDSLRAVPSTASATLSGLAAKAASGRSTPRELRALGDSLARLPEVERCLRAAAASGRLVPLLAGWESCVDLTVSVQRTLVERPPIAIGDEQTIATGHDADLDALRDLRDGGKDLIARIQSDERERTGINSLKVGFNRVFGYYIEVTRSNLHLVPSDYQRRQTITNGERFVTRGAQRV